MKTSPNPSTAGQRRGRGPLRMLVALVAVLAIGWVMSRGENDSTDGTQDSLFHVVEHGEFIYKIVEPGEVESSSNVDVVCQVQSRNSSGTVILEIVPEGTWVEKDEFICKLDDSELQNQLIKEQIDANDAESKFIQAKADLENADLALQEYESGTFPQAVKQHESEVFVSREDLRRAEEFLAYSVKLAARDYISEVQLEADRFAVEKARKELEVAETKLEVLQTLTRKKKLNELRANLRSAEVDLDSRRSIFELAKSKVVEIREQVDNCRILAPASGQVVYANRQGKYSEEVLIEEGRPVREKQVIARLPDPSKMHVVAKVNESRVDRISIGMRAQIKLDAFSRMTLDGKVIEISEYPLPPRHYLMAHIKEYATVVEIENPPEELRPGMTSEVSIQAESLPDVLLVPLQAVIEKDKGFYCLTGENPRALKALPVKLGNANAQFVVIEAGLEAGIQVAMNPRQYEEAVDFPKFPKEYQRPGRKKKSKTQDSSKQQEADVRGVSLLEKKAGKTQ